MKSYEKHKRTGISNYNLQTALKKIIYDRKDSIAFVTAKEQVSYREVAIQIERQYDEYRSRNVRRIALCMSNSIEFCIQLLTAIIYLDEIFIIPPLWDDQIIGQICKDNEIHALIMDKDKKIFYDNTYVAEFRNDVEVILFTSGTMYTPKGVVLTSENLYSNALAAIDCIKYTKTDRILVTKPLYHSYGLTVEFIAGMLVGAEFYLDSGLFNVNKVAKIMMKREITVWCTVPTLIFLFVDKNMSIPNSLRIIAVGGARATETLLKKARNFWAPIPVIQMYGLTEAGPLVTCTPFDLPAEKIKSIGKPVKGVNLEIRDKEDRLINTPEVSGELVVKSKGVMKGYLNDETATQKVKRNGRLYTGDICYFDIDNYYYIQDRNDSMIVRDGINIYCSEIENVLMELDEIEQISIIGIEDTMHSQIAIAFIKADVSIERLKIISWCRDKGVSPPDDVIFVDNLPYNDNGKVDITKLKAIYYEHTKGAQNE